MMVRPPAAEELSRLHVYDEAMLVGDCSTVAGFAKTEVVSAIPAIRKNAGDSSNVLLPQVHMNFGCT